MAKKLLLVILIISMFAANTFVFAAEDNDKGSISYYSEYDELNEYVMSSYDKAYALHIAGLFDGISTQSFNPGLDMPLTREQAMKIILSTLHIQVIDNTKSPFSDISPWAAPFVAKAYELGITRGVSKTQFGGTNSTTIKELFTFYLRAMGCDSVESYANTVALAAEFGLLGEYKETDMSRNAYREDVVSIAYDVVTLLNSNKLEYKYGADGEESTGLTFWTLTALLGGDFERLSHYIHPVKGTLFSASPYIYEDQCVKATATTVTSLFSSSKIFTWGVSDGTGDPIELSFSGYSEAYLNNANYRESYIQVVYGLVTGRGNSILNYKELFPDSIAVEYYFPGTNQYEGMDFSSLILVFEEYQGNFYLVAVISNYWTI